MSDLLPTRQAEDLRRAISDYVATTIALADPSVAGALEDFLTDTEHGIFHGPYLRTRRPFAASHEHREDPRSLLPTLAPGFTPYAHQAQAFARLTTNPAAPGERDHHGMRIPQPTIVTTGTGSGKTESFLLPVLDHAARMRERGIGGVKALILYPMNALAGDQASRLARTIARHSAYDGITAALYTGEAAQSGHTTMGEEHLITERSTIRATAPDILLTNYKMLDQLLLRREDRPLWTASADTLRYLVLDEFHTYDGAQGTDIALLLRRLTLVLEPLARHDVHLTPVATSATLGDSDGAGSAMLDFARTVFGVPIESDAVIRETRKPLTQILTQAPAGAEQRTPTAEEMDQLAARHLSAGAPLDAGALLDSVIGALWTDGDGEPLRTDDTAGALFAHRLTAAALEATQEAVSLDALAEQLLPAITRHPSRRAFTSLLMAALSAVRAHASVNQCPTVEAHLWIREVTRVDRLLATDPAFVWSDERREVGEQALPAIYCRACGRSGWGAALQPDGTGLELRPGEVRAQSVARTGRFRALMLETGLAQDSPTQDIAAQDTLHPGGSETRGRVEETGATGRWLNIDAATLDATPPAKDDTDLALLPVLAYTGADATERALEQTCPACGEKDAVRFIGSSLATLLSVSLTSLFGTPGLEDREKKALVFTDSVQDAAHRAGFVEARSHALTFRSIIRAALTDEPASIIDIARRIMRDAHESAQKYRLLHPSIAGTDRIRPYYTDGASRRDAARAAELVGTRLTFDVGRELGMASEVGRTLLLTGSAVAEVRLSPGEARSIAKQALRSIPDLPIDVHERTLRWVRGTLERLRAQGAISHRWLRPFREHGGGIYYLWGGRPDRSVMPAFPRGRALPALPSIGNRSEKSAFDPAASSRSWYTDWTARSLQMDRGRAATLQRALLDALVDHGLADMVEAGTVRSYALLPERVTAQRPVVRDGRVFALECRTCGSIVPGTEGLLAVLADGPCLRARCPGVLTEHPLETSYYRRLYTADMRRIIAREHTSLLKSEERLRYESEFTSSDTTPGAPNVLVATPTLEMGIDIGDLSAVMLASVPRTVASYLQRVGRAGRLTGNALDVTFVAGRGRTAGLHSDPLDMLNGTVRAPGAYLSAAEILRRQFIASVMDVLAGDARIDPPHPRSPILASAAPGTYLGALLAEMDERGAEHLDRFLAQFPTGQAAWTGLTDTAREDLRAWALPGQKNADGDGREAPPGRESTASGRATLRRSIEMAVQQWNAEREDVHRRRQRIEQRLAELDAAPVVEDTDAQRAALQAEHRLLHLQAQDLGEAADDTDDDAQGSLLTSADPGTGDAAPLTAAEKDAEQRRLRNAALRARRERSAHTDGYWISVLERYGLLPNFTLVDDSVALDATVIWRDVDDTWQHDSATIERAAAPALTELAPQAHFYAHGRDLVIDTVDLGVNASGLATVAFCPDCGHAERIEQQVPRTCPTCGGEDIRDPGQHRDVVTLKKVYSTVTDHSSRITDADDDRRRRRFSIALAPSFTDAVRYAQWHVVSGSGQGFGVSVHRGTALTRLNLGAAQAGIEPITLGGQQHRASGFLLCGECGHHDTDSSTNERREHQAWCTQRDARESPSKQVLLERTVRTETALIIVPPSVQDLTGDQSLWHLIACLALGLEKRFGGAIDNLTFDIVQNPVRRGESAILISDDIPGGTGYIMELATAESVWGLLIAARQVLATCPCRGEGLQACHRCLLTHVPAGKAPSMSRTEALRLVSQLLGRSAEETSTGRRRAEGSTGGMGAALPVDEPIDLPVGWDVKEGQPDQKLLADSQLELDFLRTLQRALEHALPEADVRVADRDGGRGLSIFHGGRRFDLAAQQDVYGTRPDYMLTWPGAMIDGVAIYIDGRQFHATGATNRVADDAHKRQRLRENGYLVLAATHHDIEAAARALSTAGADGIAGASLGATSAPGRSATSAPGRSAAILRGGRSGQSALGAGAPLAPYIVPTMLDALLQQAPHLRRALSLLTEGVITQIVEIVRTADVSRYADLMEHLPTLIADPGRLVQASHDTLADVAAGHLSGRFTLPEPSLSHAAAAWFGEHLALLGVLDENHREVLVMLDDSEESMRADGFAEAWRQWLQIANIAQGVGERSRFTQTVLSTGQGAGHAVPGADAARTAPTASAVGAAQPSPTTQTSPTQPSSATSGATQPHPSEPGGQLSADWQALLADTVTPTEAELLRKLFDARAPLPIVGEEHEGTIVDFAWPDRRIAMFTKDLPEDQTATLRKAGWVIIGPNIPAVRDALARAASGSETEVDPRD